MDDLRKLLKKITIEEKAKLCAGKNYWQTYDIEAIGLPSMFMSDGPSGLRKQDLLSGEQSNKSESKASVCFPSGAAVASSWDKELLKKVGNSLGKKAAEENVDILLAPSINIKRTPLCGRNFEYYSEDPILSGELAAAFIEGVQENHVAACPKHFAMNNQETKRKAINVIAGKREICEIYLHNFELAVKKGKPWCIMSSYNRINGQFPAENRYILREILREEWKFDGVVISDWGAIDQIVPSVEEGFNLQMPGDSGYSAEKLAAAVKAGSLKEERLDESAARMLKLAENTVKRRETVTITDNELHQIAYEAAVESMVLLKNKDQILPLKKEDRLLFVGEMAENPRYQVGGGSAAVRSYQVDKPLDFVLMQSPHADYARGYSENGLDGDAESNALLEKALLEEALQKAEKADKIIFFAGLPASYESEGIDRQKLDLPENQNRLITQLSKCNKNVIVVLSNGSAVTMPWISRVKAVLETYLGGEAMGRAVADILFGVKNPSGKLAETFPVQLEDTPAFLSFPGENNIVEYKEGIFVGYRYYDKKKIKPLFPFGHGLSYTKFKYSGIRLGQPQFDADKSQTQNHTGQNQPWSSAEKIQSQLTADKIQSQLTADKNYPQFNTDIDETLTVSVRVENTGSCYGKEVVQLYVGKVNSKVICPVKELKGFEKIALLPGEVKTVQFKLCKRDFSYYNPAVSDWVAEPGIYQLSVGSSSERIHLHTQVELLSTDRLLLPITRNTAFGDIFDIPELSDIFQPFFDTLVANIPLEFNLGDKNGQLAKAMLRGMTFSSIASYEGKAANDEIIGDMISSLNQRLQALKGKAGRSE